MFLLYEYVKLTIRYILKKALCRFFVDDAHVLRQGSPFGDLGTKIADQVALANGRSGPELNVDRGQFAHVGIGRPTAASFQLSWQPDRRSRDYILMVYKSVKLPAVFKMGYSALSS